MELEQLFKVLDNGYLVDIYYNNGDTAESQKSLNDDYEYLIENYGDDWVWKVEVEDYDTFKITLDGNK